MAKGHPLDRDFDPALTWAGALAHSLSQLDRGELDAAWNAPDAVAHRAMLKSKLPDVLRQLVAHVQDRLTELPPRAEAA